MNPRGYKNRIYLDRAKRTKSAKILDTTLTGFNVFILYVLGAVFIIVAMFSPQKGIGFIIIIGFIGIGFFGAGLALKSNAKTIEKINTEFRKTSTTTTATVLNRYFERCSVDRYGVSGMSGYDAVIYYVVVQFYVGGKEYVVDAKVSEWLYEKADRGRLLSVTYSNSNPNVLLIEGE